MQLQVTLRTSVTVLVIVHPNRPFCMLDVEALPKPHCSHTRDAVITGGTKLLNVFPRQIAQIDFTSAGCVALVGDYRATTESGRDLRLRGLREAHRHRGALALLLILCSPSTAPW